MSLVYPEFLLRPFADTGNVSQVPQTDASGFVNYTDGYTSAYEISLNANNPLAKAVERPIQNYLFHMLSQNVIAFQRQGFPAWIPPVAGFAGYDSGAFVLRGRDEPNPALLFRSLIDDNLTDPINSPQAWELQPTVADTVGRISLPLGGILGPSGAVIGFASDFNAATDNGMFMVGNDQVAQACQNIPVYSGTGTAVSGVLEVITWTFQSVKYVIQRYTDRLGIIATRTAVGATWGAWTYKISVNQMQMGQFAYMTITSTDGTAWTGTVSPNPSAFTDGMEFKVLVAGSQAVRANANLTVNGVAGANPMFGTSGLRVVPNEFMPGSSLHIRWVAGTGWEIISINAGRPTGLTATQPTHLTTAGQAQNGTLNFVVDTRSSGTPNAYGGEFVPQITSPTRGLVVRFVAATANNGSPTFRLTAAGPDLPIRDAGGGLISSGVIQPTDVVELTYLDNQNYWVITNKTGAGAASAVPVGGIILVSTNTVPTGYLECDNSLQKIATLPQLYAAIGTFYNLAGDPADSFRLPNGRGVFVRGLDNGRGLDPGRALGSLQQPANLRHNHTGSTSSAGNHTHTWSWINTPTSSDTPGIGAAISYRNGGNISTDRINTTGAHTHDLTIDNNGGDESRPWNVAWMYCIKAFDTPINQGTIDVAALLAQVNAQRRMEPGQAIFNAAGTYSFTVPLDAVASSVFEIEIWGGGGGGSGQSTTVGGQGGGAGGYAYRMLKGLAPGSVVSLTVGRGGLAGVNGNPGGLGGNSAFGTYCVANGGDRSGGNAVIWANAPGGTATGGDLNITGGPGTGSMGSGTTLAGQFGGNGGNASRGGPGGLGGSSNVAATAGGMPGGGGGGGAPNGNPGAGADGACVIRYR